MRQIGAPRHTEEELEFARELSRSIPPEEKRTSLWKSKRPGWEKLMDELFDERVLDAWNEGMVSTGSSDVGDVSWVAPAMEFSTTCCILGTPGHRWQFTAQAGMSIGHKSLIFALKVIAATALDFITRSDILQKAGEEWKARLAGRVYKSPIPKDLRPPLRQFAKWVLPLPLIFYNPVV